MTEDFDVIIGGVDHEKSKKNKRSLTANIRSLLSCCFFFFLRVKWDISCCDRGDTVRRWC